MKTNFLMNIYKFLEHPEVIIAVRIFILMVVFFLVMAFKNISIAPADPGWGGMGG